VRVRVVAISMGLGAVLAACKPGENADEGDIEDTTGAPVDAPAPNFIDPPGGELHVSSMRFTDVELDVAVAAGATDLVIDDASVGTLQPPGPIGELTADLLRLRVRGGLVPSVHLLQLRTWDAVEPEESEVVEVFVDPEPAPELEVTLADDVIARGDAIVALGWAEQGVLATVDGEAVHSIAASGDGWDPASSHAMVLPGLVVAADDRVPAIAIERDAADSSAMLVAWRVEHPGTRVDALAARWGEESDAPTTALALDPAWIGSFETAAFHRPVLAAKLLLVELEAHADAESPRTGDHSIATVRLDADAQPGDPVRVQPLAATGSASGGGALADVDALAPALDPLGFEGLGPIAVGARLGDRPTVLDVDRDARTITVRPSATTDSFGLLDDVDGPLDTLLGAFGSRVVTGTTTDPEWLALALVDDRAGGGVVDASVAYAIGALATPSGPPAIGLVGGATVIVVPFGAEEPLFVVTVTSMDPDVVTFADVGCDRVALPQTAAGNASGALALACLRDRDLRLGTIALR
jgi:hypothetical protein